MNLVRVPMVVVEDCGLWRQHGELNPENSILTMDRRRLQRDMRRVRRTLLRVGVRPQSGWWVLFWETCRKYGVRA